MSDETSASSCSRARFLLVAGCRLVAIAVAERCGTCLIGVFIELHQIRQNDVSYQLDIRHNPPSADSTLTNRKGKARFWLRKQIWEICGMAMYNSVFD